MDEICTQPACKLTDDGKCIEGFIPPSKCPHFKKKDASENLQSFDIASVSATDLIQLHLGVEIDSSSTDVNAITRAEQSKIIICAGEEESGKTTLLASIYECFQWGKFAGLSFAGSRTLSGFEKRCHSARIASNRKKAETERTPVGPLKLLHLRLQDSTESFRNLLISDVSGENFEQMQNSVDVCRQTPILRCARRFALLLDTDRLKTPLLRSAHVQNSLMIVRSCLDSGMLQSKIPVDVLFTKWDHAPFSEQEFLSFIEHTKTTFRKSFASTMCVLEFWTVAARRVLARDNNEHNIDTLLKLWLSSDTFKKGNTYKIDDVLEGSEFERFGQKQLRSTPDE